MARQHLVPIAYLPMKACFLFQTFLQMPAVLQSAITSGCRISIRSSGRRNRSTKHLSKRFALHSTQYTAPPNDTTRICVPARIFWRLGELLRRRVSGGYSLRETNLELCALFFEVRRVGFQ